MKHTFFLALYEGAILLMALIAGMATASVMYFIAQSIYPSDNWMIFSGIAGYFAAFVVCFIGLPMYANDRRNLGMPR